VRGWCSLPDARRSRNRLDRSSVMWPGQRRLLAPRIEEADARYRALLAAVEDAQR
jgi:hypothetical protein